MPDLRPGQFWFDNGGGAPQLIVGYRMDGWPVLYHLGEMATTLNAGRGRVVLVHDEVSQLVNAVAANPELGVAWTLDQRSSPDTSQEYFLDLIARINDATDDRRFP